MGVANIALIAALAVVGYVAGVLSANPYAIKIWFTARRLQLRDRGEVEKFIDYTSGTPRRAELICSLCKTSLRVGICSDGEAVHYCWRCEYIFSTTDGHNPNGGDELPADGSDEPETLPSKVTRLEEWRRSA